MNIIAQFDATVQNAPAGYKVAVQAAIDYLDKVLLDPITVTLVFSYGSLQGTPLPSNALGESNTNGNIKPFSWVTAAFAAAATSQADHQSVAALPLTDPTNGAMFWVSDAQAKLFGAGSEPGFIDPEDGFVALSSHASFTFDPLNRAVPGKYDAIGVLEHEITEALGRIGYLGQAAFQGQTLYSPLDLFRYSAPNVHDLRAEAGSFSANGHDLLLAFNDPNTGNDAADWTTAAGNDSFGFGFLGDAQLVSSTDLLVMDVLGFNVAMPTTSDFNGDNRSDFLIRNTDGAVVVGELGGGGQAAFSQVTALGAEWSFAGSGDFVGDGNTAMLLHNNAGAVVTGEVVNGQTAYSQVGALGPEWSFKGVGDFIGDGKSEFLIENTAGAVVVGQVVGGAAVYTQIASLGPEWTFVGTGDYLANNSTDFLIENTAGAVVVGDVSATGSVTYHQIATLGPEWRFVASGDFGGDGKTGFLIENSSGAVVLGEVGSNGQTTFTQVGALGPEWSFVGEGHYLGGLHDQVLLENTSGAVVVGDIVNGHLLYTQVSSLGPEWLFHG